MDTENVLEIITFVCYNNAKEKNDLYTRSCIHASN